MPDLYHTIRDPPQYLPQIEFIGNRYGFHEPEQLVDGKNTEAFSLQATEEQQGIEPRQTYLSSLIALGA